MRSQAEKRAYWNQWCAKNKGRANDYSVQKAKFRKKNVVRTEHEKYTGTLSCATCGENHSACLEFHHTNPKNTREHVSMMITKGFSHRMIKEEMEKYIVLCSNRHQK